MIGVIGAASPYASDDKELAVSHFKINDLRRGFFGGALDGPQFRSSVP
jgi:hypothetical protein